MTLNYTVLPEIFEYFVDALDAVEAVAAELVSVEGSEDLAEVGFG